jgi:serine/threonine protein kinase
MNSDGQSYSILENKYILLKKIGKGGTSSVYLAKSIIEINNPQYAIKILKNKSSNNIEKKYFINEMTYLKQITHANIIQIHDGNEKGLLKKYNGKVKMVNFIVLELAENGEMFEYLYFTKKGFGEVIGRYIFYQLIQGLEATHNAGITHRDLKTENLLLSNDWTLKISDFGFATLLNGKKGDGVLTTILGTVAYAAPEILRKKPYIGSYVDIFSAGVILFVLVTGKLPFSKATLSDPYYKYIILNDYETFWNSIILNIGFVTEEFKNLVNCMLAYDPTQRPSISEIKSHLWLAQEFPNYNTVKAEFEERKNIVNNCKQIIKLNNGNLNNHNTGGYRSEILNEDFENVFSINDGLRTLDDYVECSNPYVIKIKADKKDEEELIKILATVYNYFTIKENQVKVTKYSEEKYKYRMIIYFKDDDAVDIDTHIYNELEIDVSVYKYDSEFVILELMKIRGDKLKFFDEYTEFCAYINE